MDKIEYGTRIVHRHTGKAHRLQHLPCRLQTGLGERARLAARCGQLVPIVGCEHSFQRHIQTAHHDGYAGFKHDLRRMGVDIDVEFRSGRDIAD